MVRSLTPVSIGRGGAAQRHPTSRWWGLARFRGNRPPIPMLPIPQSDHIYVYVDSQKRNYYIFMVLAFLVSGRLLISHNDDPIMQGVFLFLYLVNVLYVGIASLLAMASPVFSLEKHNLIKDYYEAEY